MMRIVAILVVLVAGLASLLMSVCGGIFFAAAGYNWLRSLLSPEHPGAALAGAPILMLAAGCLGIGGWVCWKCVQFIRRELSEEE